VHLVGFYSVLSLLMHEAMNVKSLIPWIYHTNILPALNSAGYVEATAFVMAIADCGHLLWQ
jgi:hypothetical protein